MVVYATHDIQDAQIVAGRLKHEGIMAMVNHALGMQAFGFTVGQMGAVQVLVHPAEYDRALDMLFPDEPDELPDGDDGDIIYTDQWSDDDDETTAQ